MTDGRKDKEICNSGFVPKNIVSKVQGNGSFFDNLCISSVLKYITLAKWYRQTGCGYISFITIINKFFHLHSKFHKNSNKQSSFFHIAAGK